MSPMSAATCFERLAVVLRVKKVYQYRSWNPGGDVSCAGGGLHRGQSVHMQKATRVEVKAVTRDPSHSLSCKIPTLQLAGTRCDVPG
ncbi:hypothetical protein IG631_21092 [Alternaria alternata]|nr:hypothetical protein IG631_21092 [Alternaria alternata]